MSIRRVLSVVLVCLLYAPIANAGSENLHILKPVPASTSDTLGVQQLWAEILREANVPVTFVDAPPSRKRRMFVEGRVLLDCCTAKQWRTDAEEQSVQRWSDVFYVNRDVFVFRRGETFRTETEAELAALKVAVVHGFSYRNQKHFGTRVPGAGPGDVLRLLAAGRADVGIISDFDFVQYPTDYKALFELGAVNEVAPQRIRVHRKVAQLLPALNRAIATLKASGRIDELLTASVNHLELPG